MVTYEILSIPRIMLDGVLNVHTQIHAFTYWIVFEKYCVYTIIPRYVMYIKHHNPLLHI